MAIDGKLYKQAREWYRQWNEAEFKDRIRNAGKLTPGEAWEQYRSLVEFCWNSCPEPGEWQRREKLEAIDKYIERVKALEAWRIKRGKGT